MDCLRWVSSILTKVYNNGVLELCLSRVARFKSAPYPYKRHTKVFRKSLTINCNCILKEWLARVP